MRRLLISMATLAMTRRDGELADPDARRSLRGTSRPLDLLHRRITGDRHLRDPRRVERGPGLRAGRTGPLDCRRPHPPRERESRAVDAWTARRADVAGSRAQLDRDYGGRRWGGRPAGATTTRVRQ